MTITLLGPDGVDITAKQYRQARSAEHGGGGGRRLGGRSGFRVDTPSNVLTATSTTWTLGPCSAMIDPGWVAHQGMYGWSTDANVTGAIDPPDDTNPRKDVVFIQVNDDTAGDGSGEVNANLVYLAGTPQANPTAPYADGFLVGTIHVPQLGGGSPSVTLNTARYASAGAPLPVYSALERDGLDKYNGLSVQRRDLAGSPTETWDGTRWANAALGVSYTPIWTGATNWGSGGSMSGKYWVRGDLVTVQARVVSGTGASLGTGIIAFPLPPGLPIAGGQRALGQGVMGGVLRPLTAVASGTTSCSLWAPQNPIQTPGTAGYTFVAGDSIDAMITYQTTI